MSCCHLSRSGTISPCRCLSPHQEDSTLRKARKDSAHSALSSLPSYASKDLAQLLTFSCDPWAIHPKEHRLWDHSLSNNSCDSWGPATQCAKPPTCLEQFQFCSSCQLLDLGHLRSSIIIRKQSFLGALRSLIPQLQQSYLFLNEFHIMIHHHRSAHFGNSF